MTKRIPILSPLSLLIAPFILALASPTAPTANGQEPTEMIVFGASRSDSGNAFALTGGFLPAPPYWQGRFSNGPNWVDQLAENLGLPVPGPFVLGGTNYAVAGAESGPGFSNTCVGNTCAPNIGLQIEFFLSGSPVIDGDELFVLQGGGNDFGQFIGLHNATITAYNMRTNIETLALAGADNFVVINLGPDHLSVHKFRTSNNAWILRFNAMLEQHLQQLETELGLTIVRVDWHALKSAMLADPADFGLTNLVDPACPQCGGDLPIVPNPEEYYLWDNVHPTTAVHGFIASMAADAVATALGLSL